MNFIGKQCEVTIRGSEFRRTVPASSKTLSISFRSNFPASLAEFSVLGRADGSKPPDPPLCTPQIAGAR